MKKLFSILALMALTFCGGAPAFAADPPAPSVEQRLSAMESYFANTDPSAPLKDKDGNIPEGMTTPAVGVPGPGHNG
ncbi:MAG: hypothetical protein H7Y43_12865, partial [Akkermansiaceae bacterium]|nr:hypothetical protein [Verrucomicrobiales bacterium]